MKDIENIPRAGQELSLEENDPIRMKISYEHMMFNARELEGFMDELREARLSNDARGEKILLTILNEKLGYLIDGAKGMRKMLHEKYNLKKIRRELRGNE